MRKGGKDQKKGAIPTADELRIKTISHLKVKTIEEFLSDPAGFLAFKAFIMTSKLSLEFTADLSFWEDVRLRYNNFLIASGRVLQGQSHHGSSHVYLQEIFRQRKPVH